MEKIKVSETQLVEMIRNSVKKVLKESLYNESDEFIPQGAYTVSNSGGYEVMISDDGSMAKVRDAFGSDNPEISDWLPIEYVDNEDGEVDDEGYPISEPVIDPDGYNIPLSQVMRINESKKSQTIKIKMSEIKETIANIIREQYAGNNFKTAFNDNDPQINEEDELNNKDVSIKKYSATVKHDNGSKKITTSASSEAAAKEKIMKAEGCPSGAIMGLKPVNSIDEESKPSAGLSKSQKSNVVKKAKAGEDIGKKGKGFEKVAQAAGGGEKGKKIAAAAMWKNIKR